MLTLIISQNNRYFFQLIFCSGSQASDSICEESCRIRSKPRVHRTLNFIVTGKSSSSQSFCWWSKHVINLLSYAQTMWWLWEKFNFQLRKCFNGRRIEKAPYREAKNLSNRRPLRLMQSTKFLLQIFCFLNAF